MKEMGSSISRGYLLPEPDQDKLEFRKAPAQYHHVLHSSADYPTARGILPWPSVMWEVASGLVLTSANDLSVYRALAS